MTNNQLAFVFPGQGSQSIGMLAELAITYPKIIDTFTQASEVLGYDLWKLTQEGPAAELDKTAQTQPALLAASYALWLVMQNYLTIKPALLAGHSLGEYTALVCAGSLNFRDAIKLVAARGNFMQAAVPQGTGAMAALIGLDNETVETICSEISTKEQVVSPANFNSIGQIVVAGHKNAVEKAIHLAKEKGAKLATLIPVSVPSHCELMKPAAEKLATILTSIQFKSPAITIINNADVKPYQNENDIRDGLIRQLYKPVRWVETIQYFVKNGVDTIIECGPGKILTGLNKRIDKNLKLLTTADRSTLSTVLEEKN